MCPQPLTMDVPRGQVIRGTRRRPPGMQQATITGRRKDDMKEVVERRGETLPGVVRNEDSGGRFGPSDHLFLLSLSLLRHRCATGAMRGAATRRKCAIWRPLVDADVPFSLLPALLSLLLLRFDTADTVSNGRAGGASTPMFHPPLPHPALHTRRCARLLILLSSSSSCLPSVGRTAAHQAPIVGCACAAICHSGELHVLHLSIVTLPSLCTDCTHRQRHGREDPPSIHLARYLRPGVPPAAPPRTTAIDTLARSLAPASHRIPILTGMHVPTLAR
ncbi:hypothetical protein B0H14DRAFT_3871750 [Mycena olivaceomarginata]|nr:hypothetical protein B0H14DRAFT_3871750 [Mycena olivaceomarginata]